MAAGHSENHPSEPSSDSRLYQPLPSHHTRVGLLEPGQVDEPLRVQLVVLDLEDPQLKAVPKPNLGGWTPEADNVVAANASKLHPRHGFNALSYVWGASRVLEELKITDESGRRGRISLTQSLVVALKRIRLAQNPCFIWADQISINQNSDSEKSVQIPLMNLIYQRASRVLAWLGLEKDDSDLAMGKLEDLNTKMHAMPVMIDIFSSGKSLRPDWVQKLLGPDTAGNIRMWRAVAALMSKQQRPWWSRKWILQEVTGGSWSSTSLVCGSKSVSFFGLVALLRLGADLVRHIEQPVPQSLLFLRTLDGGEFLWRIIELSMLRHSALTEADQPQLNLLELAKTTRAFRTSDVRDSIFSLLGVAQDTADPGIPFPADYSESPEQVYTRFTAWCLQKYRNLDFLQSCGDSRPLWEARELPSWVPEWAKPEKTDQWELYRWKGAEKVHLYSPSGEKALRTQPYETPSQSASTLALTGLRVCTIHSHALLTEEGWRSTVTDASLSETQCPLNQLSLDEVVFRTLSFHLDPNEELVIPAGDLETRMKTLEPDLQFFRNTCLLTVGNTSMEGETLIALGPYRSQPELEIWTFKGGSTFYALFPYIVMDTMHAHCLDHTDGSGGINSVVRFAKGGTIYRLVGPCFILGLMNGELREMIGDNRTRPRPAPLTDMDSDFRNVFLI